MRDRPSTHRRDDVEMLRGEQHRRNRGGGPKGTAATQMPEDEAAMDRFFGNAIHQHDADEKLSPSGPYVQTDPVGPGKQREKSPHRQADQQRDDNRSHSRLAQTPARAATL